MKNKILLLFLLFLSLTSEGQIIIDSSVTSFLSKYPNVEIVPIKRDTSYWNIDGKMEVLFTENYYKDWNAGGDNSATGLTKIDWKAIYNKYNLNWSNILRVEYGMIRQQDKGPRKTNDVAEFTSNFGYLVGDKWYASSQLRFTTQLANGYDYGDNDTADDDILKSALFSPGKLFVGVGMKYIRDDNFFIYLSPFTENTTFILNEELAEKGDINKNKQQIYNKIGPWVDVYWNYKFYRDYSLINKVSLYTDYFRDFGSLDYFDWQLELLLPLHKYFTVSFGFQMKFEKDILFDVEDSNGNNTGEKETRIQIRQNLGIGLKYEF